MMILTRRTWLWSIVALASIGRIVTTGLFFRSRNQAELTTTGGLPSFNVNKVVTIVSSTSNQSSFIIDDADDGSERSVDHNNVNGNNDKPRLILHVGLPKTATTFLQCTLCSSNFASDLLKGSNAVYVGTCPYRNCDLDSMPKQYVKHRFQAIFHGPAWMIPDGRMNPWGPVLHSSPEYVQQQQVSKRPPNNNRTIIQPLLNREFVQRLDDISRSGRNALLVYEGFHRVSAPAIEAMFREFARRFRVSVFVMYRPLYEWLPSKFNSRVRSLPGRWPGEDDHPVSFDLDNRGEFSTLVRSIEGTQQHPAETVRDNYARYFDDVRVVPMHALASQEEDSTMSVDGMDPKLELLLCSLSGDLCDRISKDVSIANTLKELTNERASHAAVSLDYDILACEAYRSGMVVPKNNITRRRLRQSMKQWQENTLGKTAKDFLKLCLSESKLNRIKELSWNLEKRLFGTDYQQIHDEGFREAVAKQEKYCAVDANLTLQQPEWQRYFESF